VGIYGKCKKLEKFVLKNWGVVKREAVGARVAVVGWQWYQSIREISAVILVVVSLRLSEY
jgi:hypothetical protein